MPSPLLTVHAASKVSRGQTDRRKEAEQNERHVIWRKRC